MIDRGTIALLAGLAVLLMPLPAVASSVCRFEAAPVILSSEGAANQPGSMILQRWEEADRSILSSFVDPEGSYSRYVATLDASNVETDPVALLRRMPSTNNDLVIKRADEWIAPATCLEKLLVGTQHDRMDMIKSPTEFVAIVLRHPGDRRVRIYSYTININGIGRMTPITDAVKDDVSSGWVIDHVVHNHPFQLAGPTLNGVLAPSIPDAGFHASFAISHDLREARITNGRDTVSIPGSSFADFER